MTPSPRHRRASRVPTSAPLKSHELGRHKKSPFGRWLRFRHTAEWTAILGVVGALFAAYWWDAYKTPRLNVEYAAYTRYFVFPPPNQDGSRHMLMQVWDVVNLCRNYTLRWTVSEGGYFENADGTFHLLVKLQNNGKVDTENIVVSAPNGFEVAPIIRTTPNVAAARVGTVTGGTTVTLDRLSARASAIVEFSWSVPLTKFEETIRLANVRVPYTSARGVRERLAGKAKSLEAVLAEQDRLSVAGGDSSGRPWIGFRTPGKAFTAVAMLEAAGDPHLSFTGTCGYVGPPKKGPDSGAVLRDTLEQRVLPDTQRRRAMRSLR